MEYLTLLEQLMDYTFQFLAPIIGGHHFNFQKSFHSALLQGIVEKKIVL